MSAKQLTGRWLQAENNVGEVRAAGTVAQYSTLEDEAKVMKTKTEIVLYGLPKGETERYTEVLLLTNATAESIERVKVLAARDGFHSFRVAEIDLSIPPDFSKVL